MLTYVLDDLIHLRKGQSSLFIKPWPRILQAIHEFYHLFPGYFEAERRLAKTSQGYFDG